MQGERMPSEVFRNRGYHLRKLKAAVNQVVSGYLYSQRTQQRNQQPAISQMARYNSKERMAFKSPHPSNADQ